VEKFIPAEYQRTCPHCQRTFTANHLSRRYCSKECKIYANNQKAQTKRFATNNVNSILSQNRQILRGYKNTEIVSRLELQQKGFNFAYSTHVALYEDMNYICCYDTAYKFIDSDKTKVKIIFLKFK
jgi:ribosomal protein S27AE